MSLEKPAAETNNVETIELKEAANGYHQNGSQKLNVEDQNPNGHIANGNGPPKDHQQSNGAATKQLVKADSLGALPFSLLPGEHLDYQTCAKEGNVYLTNYRLFVAGLQSFFNLPLKSIEYVEMRDLHGLYIHCKYGKVARVSFDTPEDCTEWWRVITSNEASYSKLDQLFAFEYYKQTNNEQKLTNNELNDFLSNNITKRVDCEASKYVNEIKRLGFNTKNIWRTTEINTKFDVCSTYPKFHIVPRWIPDEDLKTTAHFRALKRFPSVVWRNRTNGAVIARSSQPELGWFGWRCQEDEKLLGAIAEAARLDGGTNANHDMTVSVNDVNAVTQPPPFLLVDARSYTAAVANRAKGGGCECQEYYPNCEIQFMNLPNIHAIRKSFQGVRALFLLGQEQTNWYTALEATRWLQNLSALIRSTLTIVEANDEDGRSSLVHCSDGWDRTSQLVSLAQLLLDPFYRTMKGFRILVDREWLEFGHKFADRCGHSTEKDINERSPVFFQWLDVVHQVMQQFPAAFEFNEVFLIKLLEHVYSCLFGTFLCNNVRERKENRIENSTQSVWKLLLSGRKDFVNYLYDGNAKNKVLYPNHHVRSLSLWESVFLCSKSTNDLNNLTTLMGSAEMTESTDSGNFTGLPSKAFNRVSRKTSQELNGNIPSAPAITCVQTDPNIPKHKKESNKNKNKNENRDCSNYIEGYRSNHEAGNNSSYDENDKTNLINNSTLNDEIINSNNNRCTDIQSNSCTDIQSNSNHDCECNGNSSNETLQNGEMSESLNDSMCMSDSIRTVTGDASGEHRKSLDDICVGLSSDPGGLVAFEHRTNSMRRTHSSPDSPTMNRLTRTKSVPDVMASSICVNSDVAKQFPALENNKQLFKDYRRFIDQDGLTMSYSFLDQKLIDLEIRHSQEMARLQKKLDIERQARLQQQQQYHDGFGYSPSTFSDGIQDDMLSLPDSVIGERSSISSISNDDGWEQVQFDDAVPIRWIPDYLSANCFNCGSSFTVFYRKHHCRKCGGVFCDPCTGQKICLPEEQFCSPVRVCGKCFESVTMQKRLSTSSSTATP